MKKVKKVNSDLFNKLENALSKMKKELNINENTYYIYIKFDSLLNLNEGLMVSKDFRSATFMGFELMNSCTLEVNEFEIRKYK